jgi:hypothetical protein
MAVLAREATNLTAAGRSAGTPGQMYEPPLLAAVTLVAPPAGPGAGPFYLREGGRRPAAGTFMRRTWTGYQDKVA